MKPEMMTEDMNPPESTDTQDQGEQGQGIDTIIADVKSYISDPKLVTPKTMAQLLADLEDLKTYLDGEETQSGESETQDNQDQGGLSQTLNKMRGVK